MIGRTISHYQITGKLGEGGMGVVYKAEDTQLRRTVALKFLSRETLGQEEVKARLIREAQAVASLDHPNICAVHGIHEEQTETFIAMAYIDGPSLADKIKERLLPLQEALDIAIQIGAGLQEAHEKGVVHRDVKPQNVMLTAKGQAKIMDFGLASLAGRSKLTKSGTTLGTPAYMAPEQLEGREVDRRADIWALGCVLYEMLTQRSPFTAEYEQAIAYGILNQDPEPVSAQRADVRPKVDRLIAKALAKNPNARYQHAEDLLVDLRGLAEEFKAGRSTMLRTNLGAEGPATVTTAQTANPAEALPPDVVMVRRSSQRALQAVAASATLVVLALAFVHFTEAPPETTARTVTRFSFAPEGITGATISPDGRYILYAAQGDGESSLWLRALSDESARELPGTAGVMDGFWSPDSSSIGFAVGDPDFELRRISIDGGNPITLCQLPGKVFGFLGGTWSPDGERIVFSTGLRLYEIAARGGQPQLLDAASNPRPYALYPHFLPAGGGPAALVYAASAGPDDHRVAVLNLETGEGRELGPGSRPVYSRDGYLIHGPMDSGESGLWALPFSLEALEPTGEAFPIGTAGSRATVSQGGTLAYLDSAGGRVNGTLVWRDRAGVLLETIGQPQPDMTTPALSPDGQRIAVVSTESGNLGIWVHDLIRSTKTPLTFGDARHTRVTWAPSGREIAYSMGGSGGIGRKAADGTGEPVVLVEGSAGNPDWSRDGRYLVYQGRNPDMLSDIRYLRLDTVGDAAEPVTFLSTAASERAPKLSPDGRFLAYASGESGRSEVYVRPFPDGAGKWQASLNGGLQPRWRGDGRELYYVEQGTRLMAVAVSTEQEFKLGRPQELFESADLRSNEAVPNYDLSADGQKFVTIAPVENGDEKTEPPKIRIVENWYEEFRSRGQD